jgi:hypothetical protein
MKVSSRLLTVVRPAARQGDDDQDMLALGGARVSALVKEPFLRIGSHLLGGPPMAAAPKRIELDPRSSASRMPLHASWRAA